MTFRESQRHLADEWKELPPEAKKPYEDQAEAERERSVPRRSARRCVAPACPWDLLTRAPLRPLVAGTSRR